MTRWMAAMLVVINHVRHVLMVDYGEVEAKTLFAQGLYFITGLGHEAVVLFFVVSGYLVGGITLKKWQAGRQSFAEYFAARTSRIYTVFVPALIFGGLLDYAGWMRFNGAEMYTNSAQYHTNSLNLMIYTELGWQTFFGNLLMLGNNLVPALGSNGPLWSLFYEWWYYVAYICLLGLYFRKDMGTRAMCAAVIFAVVMLMPLHWLIYMLIWLMGVGAFFYCESRLPKLPAVAGLVVFLGAMSYSRLTQGGEDTLLSLWGKDALIGLGYVLLMGALYQAAWLRVPFKRVQRELAEFSFSMYVTHFPALIFIVAALKDVYGVPFVAQPGWAQWGYFFALTLGLYAYAFVFSLMSERRTPRVKAFLVKWFGRI